MVPKSVSDFVRKHVLSNLIAKLMALALAVALWVFAFSFSTIPTFTLHHIPVHIASTEGWSVVPSGASEMAVTISYPRRFETQVEQAYQAGLIRVECVAAPEENKGDSQDVRVQLKGVNLSAPKALAIRWISFEPSEIEVRLVRETTGDVPVIPRLSTPPLGYEVTYKAPGRATVVLRGRKDVIAALTKTGIATEEIDISVPPPPYATEWTLTPFARIPSHVIFQGVKCPITCEERVQCTVVLVQKAIEKTFTSIPIRLLFPPEYPYEASLRERTTDVKIRGPAGIVNNVKPQNIVLYVDVSDLKPQELRDTQRIEAQIVNVPGGTELTIKPAIPTCAVKITEPRTAGK